MEQRRTPRRRLSRALSLVGSFAAIVAIYADVIRPWYITWGATAVEQQQPLPGDVILGEDARSQTRAITIVAPIERVWPWLAQLGQDRGGFYSFDALENLVGCEMPTVDRLRPEHQQWQVGDKLWMYPPDKAGGMGYATLRVLVPGRALAFGTHASGTPATAPEDGSWAMVLVPRNDATTRLIVRSRGLARRPFLGRLFDHAIFEPVHFAMERRMMLGIQQVAEHGSRDRLGNHAQVALWTATFVLMVTAGVLVFRRERWGGPLLAFVGAGALFQFLTLGQPPVAVGVVLVTALAWFLRKPDDSHA